MSKRFRFVAFTTLGLALVIACGGSSDDGSSSSSSSGGTADGGGDGSTNTTDSSATDGNTNNNNGNLCDPGAATACGAGRKCDPALGCVECAADGDCAAAGKDPFCILGRCEACRTNTDCGVAAPVCFPSDHRCHASCLVDGGSRCGQQSAEKLPLCDQTTGACVGCLAPTDCPATAPICEPTTKTCVSCTKNTDCPVARPKCEVPRFECVQCLVNTDCPQGQACDNENRCVPSCTADTQCTGANAPKCNTTTGRCQQCLGPADCTSVPNRPLCGTGGGDRAGRCVQCNTNTDCGDGGTPFCGKDSTCVQCLKKTDCPGVNAQCDNGQCKQ